MLIFIVLILIGMPFYWIIVPGKPSPTHEPLAEVSPALLPLGGESH